MKKSTIKSVIILLVFLIYIQATAQTIEDAIGLSHSGKYEEAEKVFSILIEKDGDNTGLLIARGFNSAWGKNYKTAQFLFNRALRIDPANADAAKGIAYTYLYKGNFTKAASAFNRLVSLHPYSIETRVALGLAYMNLQKKNKAYTQFEHVLSLNKKNVEAKKYVEEIESGKGIIELSALGGVSSSGGESKFGLRQFQAGYHLNNEVFMYARYDNSLAQDNYFFLKNNYNSNAFIGGLYARWHYRIGSKIEYGYRSLPGKTDQNIFQTEQVIFLPGSFTVKLGGSIISSQLQDDWMLMGSISVPAGRKIKIEPHYYYIRRLDDEHRILLNVSYNFSAKTDVAIGAFSGSEKNNKLNIRKNIFGVYAYSNIYITGPLSATVLTRYEQNATAGDSFIAAAGLKIRLGKK